MEDLIKGNEFIWHLRGRVKELGSQRALAQLAGVSEGSLYNWLHGVSPYGENFERLRAVIPDLPTGYAFDASKHGRRNYARTVKKHRTAFPSDVSEPEKAHDVFHHRAVYDASAAARLGIPRTERARKNISKGQKAVWEGDDARREKLRLQHTLENRVVGWGRKRLAWRGQVDEAGHSWLLEVLARRDVTLQELAAEIKVGPDYLSAALREGRRLHVFEGRNPPVRRRLGRKLRRRIAPELGLSEDDLLRLESRPLTLLEVKVWARECAATHGARNGKPPTPKTVLRIWQDRDLFPEVNWVGRPPSLTQGERAAILSKVLPLFEDARRVKGEGRLPNDHWQRVSEACYGSTALVSRARSWCRNQPQLEPYL